MEKEFCKDCVCLYEETLTYELFCDSIGLPLTALEDCPEGLKEGGEVNE
jgi:hypothetical protein